jgi:hypothetical protein
VAVGHLWGRLAGGLGVDWFFHLALDVLRDLALGERVNA